MKLWEAEHSTKLLEILQQVRRQLRDKALPLATINQAISLLIGMDDLPTAADLDAVAEEEKVREATSARTR